MTKLRIAEGLSVRAVEVRTDEAPRCELLIDGQPSGCRLPGAVLEAAVRWGEHYLLFTTDDIPFEDALHIVLLGPQLQVLDEATLGGAYTTGAFEALALHEPDAVSFRFIGDTPWKVDLLTRPGWRLPLVSEPRGVHRRLGFSRHFVVHGDPRPGR